MFEEGPKFLMKTLVPGGGFLFQHHDCFCLMNFPAAWYTRFQSARSVVRGSSENRRVPPQDGEARNDSLERSGRETPVLRPRGRRRAVGRSGRGSSRRPPAADF